MKILEILNEVTRTQMKKVTGEEVAQSLTTNCNDMVTSYLNGYGLYRGRGRKNLGFGYFDGRNAPIRKSANTQNYINLIVSNSPNWKNWPKRDRSIFGSTNPRFASDYGRLYIVFPFNDVLIGIAGNNDFWYSMDYFQKNLNINVPSFNDVLATLSKDLKIPLNDDNILEFEKDLNSLQNRLDELIKIKMSRGPTGYDDDSNEIWPTKDEYKDISEFVPYYYSDVLNFLKNQSNLLKKLYKLTDPKLNNLKILTPKNISYNKSEEYYAFEWWMEGPAYLVEHNFFKEKVEPLLTR